MNRPRTIWLGFGLCLAVLLAATGWVSWTAIRLNEAQAQMHQAEAIEEKARLALWRMDSMLAPMIAQESARPSFTYTAFYPSDPLGNSGNLIPSPLLTQVSTNVLLYFQFRPNGRITSPEVPEGHQRELAEPHFITAERLKEATMQLAAFEALMRQPVSASNTKQARESNQAVLASALPESNSSSTFLANSTPRQQPPIPKSFREQQFVNNLKELENRSQSLQQALSFNNGNAVQNTFPVSSAEVTQGALKAVWVGNSLVLGRRVVAQGQEYIQGCWLNWAGLKRSLLDSIKDLCPNATLEPSKESEDPLGRSLASLPVQLVPGPGISDENADSSPIKFILGLAWACMILATLAVGVLLHGVISLSERRAMFVSAVSHELRTPLTTFKMYSEMLASGMVTEESARRHYLNTLCSEANRLGHLIENILTYARLERGSARANIENVTVGELVARILPRLEERAIQVGLCVNISMTATVSEKLIRIDLTAVEQILFNLVDNACKYAVPTCSEKVLQVDVLAKELGFIFILVRDHGPGLSEEAKRTLFQPFGKSAQDAAKSAPGVGLGLALCKRLSRSLGGDLKVVESSAAGTMFEVRLPYSTKGATHTSPGQRPGLV